MKKSLLLLALAPLLAAGGCTHTVEYDICVYGASSAGVIAAYSAAMQGKTVVVVSHDMDEISENCTKAAVFSEGSVRYVLPPKELFRHADELTALGLDVPLTAKLCTALAKRGVEIDCDFTTEDFIGKVLAYWAAHGGRKGDNA